MNTQKSNKIENELIQVKRELEKLEISPFYWNFNKMDYVNKCLLDHENIDLINKHGIRKTHDILKKYFTKKHAENKKQGDKLRRKESAL